MRRVFKTWIRAEGLSNDIDTVVNANVLLYLGEQAKTAAACNALVRVVHEDRAASPSGRACEHGAKNLAACRDAVIRKIALRRAASGGMRGGAMATALGPCALVIFKAFDAPGFADDLR
jgi:hypothetical protein